MARGYTVVQQLGGGDKVVVECNNCGRQQGHYTTQEFECQYHCGEVVPESYGRGGAPAASGHYSTDESGWEAQF